MAFQKFHTWGGINRDNIISLLVNNNPDFAEEGQTVFDRTQENNMAWIDGPSKGGTGIMKSGDMFTTFANGTIFQFSWVSPRTGSNDSEVKAGLDTMATGDGDEQSGGNGDSCVGFAYNYPQGSTDTLAVQFSGVCECRVNGTFTQGALIEPSSTAGQAAMTSSTSNDDSFGIQLNDYNVSSGHILIKANCTEKV